MLKIAKNDAWKVIKATLVNPIAAKVSFFTKVLENESSMKKSA